MQDIFYRPHNLIVVCKQSDDSRLVAGHSYRVSKICVLRSETRFYLDPFPNEERRDNFNFAFYQDGEEIDIVKELRFWEPQLRESVLCQDQHLREYTECQIIAEQYLNCSPSLFAQQEAETKRVVNSANSSYLALRFLVYQIIKDYLDRSATDGNLRGLCERLKEQPVHNFECNRALALCTQYAEEHREVVDGKTYAVLRLSETIENIYDERMTYWEEKIRRESEAENKSK